MINIPTGQLLHWLTDPGQRTFWGFVASAYLLALIWALFNWQERAHFCLRWLKADYWWNPSTRQDYAIILINALLFALMGTATLLLILYVANAVYELLGLLFKPLFLADLHGTISLILFALILILADDLTRYALHRALHWRWLWPIHRFHHNAAVLTPFTFLRVHPLEKLLYQWRTALVYGGISGSYFFLFGNHAPPLTIFGISASVLLFNLLGANLRHSQIPIQYGKAEQWFISPAQHQHHHSVDGSRYNFGSMLAIWDRMFSSWRDGTHRAPLPSHNIPLTDQLLLRYKKTS